MAGLCTLSVLGCRSIQDPRLLGQVFWDPGQEGQVNFDPERPDLITVLQGGEKFIPAERDQCVELLLQLLGNVTGGPGVDGAYGGPGAPPPLMLLAASFSLCSLPEAAAAAATACALDRGYSSCSDSRSESEEEDEDDDSVSMNSLDLGTMRLSPRVRRFSQVTEERSSLRWLVLLLPQGLVLAGSGGITTLAPSASAAAGSSGRWQLAPSPAEVLSVRLVGFLPADLRAGAGAFSAGVPGTAGGWAAVVTATATAAGGDFCFTPLLPGALFAVLGLCSSLQVLLRSFSLRLVWQPSGSFPQSCTSSLAGV